MTLDRAWLDRIDAILAEAVALRVTPGAVLLVGDGDAILAEHHVGTLGSVPNQPVDSSTLYDLSSLTKPLATVSALLLLAAAGRLSFEDPVTRWVPEFAADPAGHPASDRADIRLQDLLAHRSGLPAHRRFFAEISPELVGRQPEGAAQILEMAAREPLECAPRTRAIYSDLGFLLLGCVVERASGLALDHYCARELFVPLGLDAIGFIRHADRTGQARELPLSRIAPCGRCSWRSMDIHGVVQDENAYVMGGVAGHAGLFSTARSVHRLVAELVRALRGLPSLFERDLVRLVWTKDTTTPGSSWALGWDTPAVQGSSAGSRISAWAVGHLGFTGTSVWLDLDRGVHVVFLTNRIHEGGDNRSVRELRPRVHDAVFAGLG